MTKDIDRMSDVQALQFIYDMLIADHHHSYFKYMTRLWCIIADMQRQAVAEAAKPPPPRQWVDISYLLEGNRWYARSEAEGVMVSRDGITWKRIGDYDQRQKEE